MNWLAHAFLSKPEVEVRLGNLLADIVKGPDRAMMTAGFLEGVRQHQIIDGFTDVHPVVHRSKARIAGRYRHVTGVLVDIFYDHFLAIGWERYCAEPLTVFTARLYTDIRSHPIRLPAGTQAVVDAILAEDRLASYRHLDGIKTVLQRMSMRLSARVGRDLRLEQAVSDLIANFDALEQDFMEFFPALQEHVASVTP